MTTSAITHREASHRLLGQSRAGLEAGDLQQASEKAWGAAAQIIKAAAEQRGWSHDQHRYLWIAAQDLAKEADDQEIHDFFVIANGLHVNFYENTFDASRVALNIGRVEQFVDKVEGMLEG